MSEVLFTINGFEVRSKHTYTIKNKPDLNAPSGFIQEGTTKLPSGVDESFQCRYDHQSDQWDSGFYDYCPQFQGLDEKEATREAKIRFDGVAKPYMRVKGIKDKDTFSPHNTDFWKKQNFKIWANRVYSTDNPVDVFELYMAINAYQLTPKELEKDPRYARSAYIISDTSKVRKLKEERVMTKFTAVSVFTNILSADKQGLCDIMSYLGTPTDVSMDDASVMALFEEQLLSKDDKLRLFDAAVKDYENGKSDKFVIYRNLAKMYGGSKFIRKANGTFAFDGVDVGQDVKSAAENIAVNPKLEEIKRQIILDNED